VLPVDSRVPGRDGFQDLELPVGGRGERGALALALAVEDQDGAPVAAGEVVGAGRVGGVVRDEDQLGVAAAGEVLAREEEVQCPRAVGEPVQSAPGEQRGHVPAVGDDVDVLQRETALLEAEGGGVQRGLAVAVLVPGEAFLLGERDHLPVDQEAGGPVVARARPAIHTKNSHGKSFPSYGPWAR
jgi:hypothetical protein